MPPNQSAVRVWHVNEVKQRTAAITPICLCAQLTEMEQQVGVARE